MIAILEREINGFRDRFSVMINQKAGIERKWLTIEELQKIYANCTNNRDKAIVLLSFEHGLRCTELCRLRWENVDLDRKEIFISRVKNGGSCNHPLSKEAVRLLKSFKRTSLHEWIFKGFKGENLSESAVRKICDRLSKLSGVKFHHHCLRHSCGHHRAELGTDPLTLQRYLGHRNPNSTQVYIEGAGYQFKNLPKPIELS